MEWFRMYAEFASDPKVQSMSEAMQRRLMMLLCLRCSNTLVTLQDDEICFALRISNEDLAETKVLFIRKGFINDAWEISNWDKRQFVSDSSAARVARHRERKKEEAKQVCNVTVTPQIQNITDTDTEQKKEKTTAAPKYSAIDDLIANGVEQQTASDWLAVRKGKKAAPTKTSIEGVLREIAKAGMSADQGIRLCCERGWAGFNPAWLENAQARASPQSYESEKDKQRRLVAEQLKGAKHGPQPTIIDIN